MKTRITRWLNCLMLAALLNAVSGTALSLHIRLSDIGDSHDPAGHDGRHDDASCSICLFLTTTAGKYIIEADTTGWLAGHADEHTVIIEWSHPFCIAHWPRAPRGPPQLA